MGSIEFMKKQLWKCMINLKNVHPNSPPEHEKNIEKKIEYYTEAIEALEAYYENKSQA